MHKNAVFACVLVFQSQVLMQLLFLSFITGFEILSSFVYLPQQDNLIFKRKEMKKKKTDSFISIQVLVMVVLKGGWWVLFFNQCECSDDPNPQSCMDVDFGAYP